MGIRAHMRGTEKLVMISARNKRDSQKRRGSVSLGRAQEPEPLMRLQGLQGSKSDKTFEDGAASAASLLRKNLEDDAKIMAKAADDVAFLRLDADIGPDGHVNLKMIF